MSHLSKIEAYIARDRPRAAKDVGARLRSSFEHLRVFPGTGRVGDEPGTREWPVTNLPYIVVFRVKNDVPEIVGVFHTARKHRI